MCQLFEAGGRLRPEHLTIGLDRIRSGDGAYALQAAQAADNASAEKIEREFFNRFIGLGRGELLPYGSYCLPGFLNERPLARLREDLQAHGIERAERRLEPE
jgi:TorA maturation chaperone TorD